ncbi:MAG: leucine-rich repeat protein [Prevotella sp.]|nr:leucine-rich repeat protein [Prevotella sp.]
MKHNRIKFLLPLLLCIASLTASAHDFTMGGIYYNITSSTDLTVAVTYRGYYYDSFSNEYSGQVTIPETVAYNGNTYRVTSIGNRAFHGCSSLTAVTIPNSVTSIGDEAFYGCTGLTAVTIPNSVTSIGYAAFKGCSGLTSPVYNSTLFAYLPTSISGSYNIPDGIKKISGGAFYNCSGLTAVTIPNSVTSIGDEAFYECSGLTALTIPNSVTSIGRSAFSGCSGLTAVTIGNSVTSIGDKAFYRANLKKTIWLTNTPPSGYTYAAGAINYVANEQYTYLNNKTVYPFLSSIFEVDGIKYVPVIPSERTCDAIDCVFDSTATHTKILPTATYRGVTLKVLNVQPYVCYNNDFIKDLVVDNDGSIATSAFENCDSLETAVLGKKITALGDNAFKSCAKLKSIIIPDSVKTLGSYSFSGCSALETIHIGANVKEIGSYAFQGCKSLPSISIPAATTDIKDYVFSGCNGLKTVLIEDRKAELNLGSNYSSPLFADCPLDSVYIGGNITYSTSSNRGYSPFYRNTTLRSVTITDKETEISQNEFYGCTNLQNVRIGDGVTTIGDWAFSGCSSLSYFAFGTKVNSIGKEAFSDCTNVSSIISNAATPPVCGSQALDDINKWGCTLYVPKGYTKQYQEADQWKEFFFVEETDFVPPIDLTEEFGKDFFTDISILVSVISAGNYDNTFDVNGDGKIDIGDIMTVIKEKAITDDNSGSGNDDPTYTGKYIRPQAVNLGLSVKWGSFNLGSKSETDFGEYFGWGDVTETLTVNDRGALYASGKFNTSIGGDVAYDIVAKELGGHWRMPTAKEIEELNTCTITFVKDYQNTGVKGWLFTRNGNSLFFPCAGYQDTGGLEDTQFAYIWSDSTYNSTYQAYSYRIYDNVSVKPANSMRNLHLSLRPVYDDGGSSDPGTSQGGGEVTPPVQNQEIPTDGIDMGLGVRWAPQNIGAKKSSEVGNYFAWGEIKTKDSFTEDNYVSPYKGIGRGDSGFQTIDAENDAATQLWGDKWRMPTMDEIGALRSTCTVSSPVTRDGVVGFVFKSNINGAELFFPAGGSKVGTNATHNSADMCYWTSTVYTSSLNEEQRVNWATCIKGSYSEDPYLHGTSRFYGLLIRPVMK